MPDILSVRETVRRCQQEGLPVSEYTLRQWIKGGVIPTRKVGQKSLIYFPNLAAYLRCESGTGDAPALVVTGGIRRVDEWG